LSGLLSERLRWLVSKSEAGRGFLWACAALSFLGTLTAAYPVTAVVAPAGFVAPSRWPQIASVSAFGSALGATLLVGIFHHLGWNQFFAYFPEATSQVLWVRIIDWMTEYGLIALFFVSISPIPQTPALIFFSLTEQANPLIFSVIFLGKLVKYGFVAWVASRFPSAFDSLGRPGGKKSQ
jgi:membrane protein YqaA with SNARE-associated domain